MTVACSIARWVSGLQSISPGGFNMIDDLVERVATIGRRGTCVLAFSFLIGACGDESRQPDQGLRQQSEALESNPARRTYKVGHSGMSVSLLGSTGEARTIAVELWYPAGNAGWASANPARYSSRLRNVPLVSGLDPLTWEIVSEVARSDAPLDETGPGFPLVVFSHGSTNAPIDYTPTLEGIARLGYVVAGPWHFGNTQDDLRTDFINNLVGFPLLPRLRSQG